MASEGAAVAGPEALKEALLRLEEAELALFGARRAEEAVARARRALQGLAGGPISAVPSPRGAFEVGESEAYRSLTAPVPGDVSLMPPVPAPMMPALNTTELMALPAEEEEDDGIPMDCLGSHVVDEVLLPITARAGGRLAQKQQLLLPVRAASSPYVDNNSEAALRNPFGTWTLNDLRRGYVMIPSGCGLRAPVFFPNGKYAMGWDLLGLVFIIFETFALPVYLSFGTQPQGVWLWVVSAVNVYFMVDIPFNFRRAYKEVGGQMVVSPGVIASRYCKWVAMDILAGIPWEWITPLMHSSGSTGRWTQLFKLLRLFRVARLLRLLRIRILPEAVKMFIEGNTLLTFVQGCLRVIFCLFSVTHWAACIWFCIGTSSEEEATWVLAHIPAGATFTTEYMYSLYFTLTTMTTVGYGDITPQNDTEVFFTLCLLLIATVVFATLMGALTDLICSLQGESSSMDARVRMLSHYMSWRQVPPQLFKSLRKHLLYLWETQQGYDTYELELKSSLTPVLREELFYHIYGQMLRSATFLSWLWNYEVCLKELSTAVSSMTLSRGDYMFRRGQANESVYVLQSGSVRVTLNESLHKHEIQDEEDEEEDHHGLLRYLTTLNQGGGKAGNGDQPLSPRTPAVFKSAILQKATERLQKQDGRENLAANYIQRVWKRIRLRRLFANPTGLEHVLCPRSRSVGAPAHFGESCLWQPVTSWGREEPPSHGYSVRCETRCDLAAIPRAQLHALLRRYSPWLQQRFERFQLEVLDGMRQRALRSSTCSSRSSTKERPSRSASRSNTKEMPLAAEKTPQKPAKPAPRRPQVDAAGQRLAALALQSRDVACKLLSGSAEHHAPHVKHEAPRHRGYTAPAPGAYDVAALGASRGDGPMGGGWMPPVTRHHGPGLGHLDMSSHSHGQQHWGSLRDPLLPRH